MSGGATEWEDLLIQHGILKAPVNPKQEEQEMVYSVKEEKGQGILSESDLEDDFNDDSQFFSKYRAQRLQELQTSARGVFGTVVEISRPDFVEQVTETSRKHFVFVHLYQDSIEACQLVKRTLQTLARTYPNFKFVEILSTRCIENYSDAHLPTILVYKDANVFSQMLRATPEQIEGFAKKIAQVLEEKQNGE